MNRKSAYSVGDVVRLKHQVSFIFGNKKPIPAGTEMKVTNKDWMGLDAETKDGILASGLADWRLDYVGQNFTS